MDEFFDNVEFRADGCWIWTGRTWSDGRYGAFSFGRRLISAHRVSYQMFNGLLEDGKEVCHECDNSLCVNPAHLCLGSHSKNMKDAADRGRIRYADQKGSHNANAKRSGEEIEAIRKYHQENQCSYGELARVFGLKSKGYAHAIVKRLIWA